MIDLTVWSLLIDILLMGALMYLAYRLTRAESVAVKIDKVGDLEKTLRKIINDAEESSIILDQKLHTRQKDLETLLDDLKSLEERVNASFKSSNIVKENLEKNLENGKILIKKLASLASLANKEKSRTYVPTEISADNKVEVLSQETNNSKNTLKPIELVDDSKEDIIITDFRTNQIRNDIESEKQYVLKDSYAKTLNNKPKSTLAEQIQKESYVIDKKPEINKIDAEKIEFSRTIKNRQIAEALIKRGIPVNVISEKTNISTDELLKMKNETVSDSDVNKIVTSSDDARLGVLSKMRREVTTL